MLIWTNKNEEKTNDSNRHFDKDKSPAGASFQLLNLHF